MAFVVAHEGDCPTVDVRTCSCDWERLVVETEFEAAGSLSDRVVAARRAVVEAALAQVSDSEQLVGYTGGRLEDLAPTELDVQQFGLRVALAVQRRLRELVAEFSPVSDDPFRQYPGRLPGTLKRSWELGYVVFAGGRYMVEVYTADPVAPYVEWNTQPHRIRPKPEKVAAAAAVGKTAMLRWWDRRTGQMVFAHEVLHPGTTGQHMMSRALDALQLEFGSIVKAELSGVGT